MNNSRRRMVVQRYNNRPPFDMKSKEMAPGKDYKKSYEHVEKSFRTIMNHLDAIQAEDDLIEPPEKKSPFLRTPNNAKLKTNPNILNPVPRIVLESFQKATPKRQPLGLRNNPRRTVPRTEARLKRPPKTAGPNEGGKFALQTLYRNKNIDFGKNVPNHQIMRNLLQNYDEPIEEYHPPVRKATSTNKPTIKRLDKATSTTDIPREEPHQTPSRKPSYKLRMSQESKTRMPQKQSRGLISKTCASRTSTEEPFLTDNTIISSPSYVCSIPESNFVMEHDGQTDTSNGNYVSRQVKKLNNYNNNTNNNNRETSDRYGKNVSFAKKNDNVRSGAKKNGYRLQKLKSQSKMKVKNVASRNYLRMMDTVKKKVPRIETNTETTSTDKYDWSDDQPEPQTTPHVKFPKETRCAMERIMATSKVPEYMRTPLTKYMKSKELSIKPAIPFNHKDASVRKTAYTRNTSPYAMCTKLETIPSKESGGIGDHVVPNVINSSKGIPCGRPGSRVTRVVQKPRGVR